MGYAIQPQEMPGNNITRSRSPLPTTYTLHGETLEAVASARYLGVDIANDLSWKTHVSRIINNANKSLGFLRRNLKTKKNLTKGKCIQGYCQTPAGVCFSSMRPPH